jgi:hypothetical protein
MTITDLPEMVRQAWGPEIAQDFTVWLAKQLSAVGPGNCPISRHGVSINESRWSGKNRMSLC